MYVVEFVLEKKGSSQIMPQKKYRPTIVVLIIEDNPNYLAAIISCIIKRQQTDFTLKVIPINPTIEKEIITSDQFLKMITGKTTSVEEPILTLLDDELGKSFNGTTLANSGKLRNIISISSNDVPWTPFCFPCKMCLTIPEQIDYAVNELFEVIRSAIEHYMPTLFLKKKTTA